MAKHYFTFGCGIDQPHRNCYVIINSISPGQARAKMIQLFGTNWAFQYDDKDWMVPSDENPSIKIPQDKKWNLKCIGTYNA